MRDKPRLVLEMKDNRLATALKIKALQENKKGMRELVIEALTDKYPELKELI